MHRFSGANYSLLYFRDRDIKDERDRDREEVRENGTNGEDRKGEFILPSRTKN
jgi:hypothetical protein